MGDRRMHGGIISGIPAGKQEVLSVELFSTAFEWNPRAVRLVALALSIRHLFLEIRLTCELW